MSGYVVAKRGEPLSLGDWSGVLGDLIPDEVLDGLPPGRVETLERVRLIRKAPGS